MAHHGRAGKNSVPSGNAKGAPALNALQPGNDKTPAGGAKKARGRHARTTQTDIHAGPNAKEGNVWQERQTEANRPIGRGGGKLRGDRQNTQPDPGMRGQRENRGLRTDHNPQSTAGRRNNKVPNQGG
jgi:hypothetical protein